MTVDIISMIRNEVKELKENREIERSLLRGEVYPEDVCRRYRRMHRRLSIITFYSIFTWAAISIVLLYIFGMFWLEAFVLFPVFLVPIFYAGFKLHGLLYEVRGKYGLVRYVKE